MLDTEIIKLCNTMEKIGAALTGLKVRVVRLDPKQGIGCSSRTKNNAVISLAFDYNFKDISEDEKKIILFGVYAHEIMHIIRTGFAYEQEVLKNYALLEKIERHKIANICEDPAIEFFADVELSEFLCRCLKQAIRYFYKHGCAIDAPNIESAYMQWVTATIQFGDVGLLKGNFTFLEAKEAFRKTSEILINLIEEPDFKNRFAMSQKIFEIVRPLWEEHQKKALANNLMDNLMKQLGKGISEGSSNEISNAEGNPENASNTRRKKTLHLLTEDEAKEQGIDTSQSEGTGNSDDASDIYSTVDGKQDPDSNNASNSSLSDIDDVDITEKAKEYLENQQKPENDDTNNGASLSSGLNNSEDKKKNDGQSEDNNASESQKENPVDSKTDNNNSGLTDKNDDSGSFENNSSEESPSSDKNDENSDDSTGINSSENSSENNMSNQDMSPSSPGASNSHMSNDSAGANRNPDGRPVTKEELLGEEIKSFESESEDIEELSQEIKDLVKANEKSRMTESKKQDNTQLTEPESELKVEVKSPYFSRPTYVVSNTLSRNASAYESIKTEMNSHIVNLKAQLRKVFKENRQAREYRTNGKLDIPRVCGRKLTARMFTKKVAPSTRMDLAIEIMVDQSGSMNKQIRNVKNTVILLMEAFAEFDIPIKIVGFETRGGADANYQHFNSWKNNKAARETAVTLHASGGTFLGHAIRYGGEILKKRPEQHKIYIVITDGEPYWHGYSGKNDGMNDCRYAVQEIRKFADVIGIGVYSSKKQEEDFRFIFKDACVSMDDLSLLVKDLPKKVRKIIETY